MISFDSSILLHSYSKASPLHEFARAFLEELSGRNDVAISELVLVEFYTLLRNPKVLAHPLDSGSAAAVVGTYQRHPRWLRLGFDLDSVLLHDRLWKFAARPGFARRGIFDARLALTLRLQGVTEFATVNEVDFGDFGFERVWNPLA